MKRNHGRGRLAAVWMATFLLAGWALAHCQIPCGIYDDDTRAKLMAEHITTIAKSMKEIVSLSGEKEVNHNQLVRWVENKEQHAARLSEIVTYYFMAQRIKPADKGDEKAHKAYVRKLTILHRMLVAAMKAKQTTDLKYVEELRQLLHEFLDAYEGFTHSH